MERKPHHIKCPAIFNNSATCLCKEIDEETPKPVHHPACATLIQERHDCTCYHYADTRKRWFKDQINPSHYKSHPSGVECIEVTRHMNFNCGNAVKYIWRNGLKDGNPSIQELKKAAWYLNDEIKTLEAVEKKQQAFKQGIDNIMKERKDDE